VGPMGLGRKLPDVHVSSVAGGAVQEHGDGFRHGSDQRHDDEVHGQPPRRPARDVGHVLRDEPPSVLPVHRVPLTEVEAVTLVEGPVGAVPNLEVFGALGDRLKRFWVTLQLVRLHFAP